MSLLEAIERLCDVVRLQSEIIKKQAEIIEQSTIADEVAEDLRKLRATASEEETLINKYYN